MKLREHPKIKAVPSGPASSYGKVTGFEGAGEKLVLKKAELVQPGPGNQHWVIKLHFETGGRSFLTLYGEGLEEFGTNLVKTLNGHIGKTLEYIRNHLEISESGKELG